MDILQAANGKEYVLELNSSSIGLSAAHRSEDVSHIVEVVLQRLQTVSARLRTHQLINAARTEIRARDKLALILKSPAEVAIVARALYNALLAGDAALELRLLQPSKILRPCAPALLRRMAFVWVEVARRNAAEADVSFLLAECAARLGNAELGGRDDLSNCVELMVEIGICALPG